MEVAPPDPSATSVDVAQRTPVDHFLIVLLRTPEQAAHACLRGAERLSKGWGALFNLKLIFLFGGIASFLFAAWVAFLWPVARHLERELVPALRVLTIVVLAVYIDAIVRVVGAGLDSAVDVDPADQVIWLTGLGTALLDRAASGRSSYAV